LDFGHYYVKAEFWSANSDAIMLAQWGHADEPYAHKLYWLDRWLCVYDLKKMAVSESLDIMNRNVLRH
jgi:hypothetical protein